MLFTILLEKKGLYAKLNGSNRESEAEYHGKYI